MDQAVLEGMRIVLKCMPVSYAMDYTGDAACRTTGKDIFIREFLHQYKMYSEDEVRYIYDILMNQEKSLPLAAFKRMIEIAEEYLYMDGMNIRCHQDKVLEFREVSMGIGQSFFISAFLAARRIKLARDDTPIYAAPLVKTDDLRLRHILSNGMAENHFHLNGSAPTALLSWICLMNHPSRRDGEFKTFHELRNFFPLPQEDKGESLHTQIIYAAAFRLALYYIMNGHQEEAEGVRSWIRLYRAGIENAEGLQLLIDRERILVGSDVLDYIRFPIMKEPLFNPIAGEQVFLMDMFRCVLQEDSLMQWVGVMYAYLIIYCRFYGEMIQSNQAVGFYNFMRYQDRKEIFLDAYPRYSYQVKKMALEMALRQKSIISLEARIAPKSTRQALVSQQKLFTGKIFTCSKERCQGCVYYEELMEQCQDRQCRKVFERLFFVYHFIKHPDEEPGSLSLGINAGDLKCRHFNLRRGSVWPVIWKLSRLRKEEPVFNHVYGLDACNREIGCRPEVFAPYFRYAREQDTYMEHPVLKECSIPRLRITYHVGEDFLDVLDGLRAISEAIMFMELRSGDRLGHALALGVDVHEWYRMKNMRLYINRQDYLDNTVFLYDMLMKHQLDRPMLQQRLKADYYKELKVLYPSLREASIGEYIGSMKLRGDEPGEYAVLEECLDGVSMECGWKILDYPEAKAARRNSMSLRLFHQYHYDARAKYEGFRPVEVRVTEDYVDAVAEVQQILREEIAERGLGIECNPSSNILIGTAKNYIEHPILCFNHYGLSALEQERDTELFVSINTDDLGVFDTDLENEYALMVCALRQEKDGDGRPKFQAAEIYRWVDHLRCMGIEQSFKLSDKIEGD